MVALLFERPSTRTRVSFEAGVVELGGHPMVLRPGEPQLTRGESLRDTALVLSRHVAAVGVRTGADAVLEELAEHGSIPVFNMLTAEHHPAQALADLLTLREAFGGLDGLQAGLRRRRQQRRALAGASLGAIAGVEVVIASPEGYQLQGDAHGALLVRDPHEAVDGAHAVYTDVWVRMGDEETAEERRRALAPYRLDDALLDGAADGAIALHCLPAHPGEEITRRGALRGAPAHLGPGREPPARPEGAARVAARYLSETSAARPTLPWSSTARIATSASRPPARPASAGRPGPPV